MAKYYGVSGKRIKSVGNETYALSSGVNVVKKKIIKTNDAKTPEQIMQRSKLQNCVKAYKQIGSDFLNGCFPAAKNGRSVYNAFVKANIKNGSPLHKQYSDDPNIIGIGAKTISNGVLSEVNFEKFYDTDGGQFYGIKVLNTTPIDGSATVSAVTTALKTNLGTLIQIGDYINFGRVYNQGVEFTNNADAPLIVRENHFVSKKIVNFKTSSTDTTPIINKGFIVVEATVNPDDVNKVHVLTMAESANQDDGVSVTFYCDVQELGYCFCVLGRKSGSKILTSKSHIHATRGYNSLITLIEANPFQQNGWLATIAKIAIITSYLAKKIAEIIQDWPI